MKATGGGVFTAQASADRIDEILYAADAAYEEVNSLPARDKLTFTNGFYANCTAIYIDIRNSSKLPDKYRRPTLAKVYRPFISESVAVVNAAERCVEVNIHGDGVWGVLDTPYTSDIDWAFELAGRLRSVVDVLNCRFKEFGIDPIATGIGMSYGRALMIKAGHKSSTINEVVWMGDPLSGYGSRGLWDPPVMLDKVVRDNLKEEYQKLCSLNSNYGCYQPTLRTQQ